MSMRVHCPTAHRARQDIRPTRGCPRGWRPMLGRGTAITGHLACRSTPWRTEVKGLPHRHRLRQESAAFIQGRSLVQDAEKRGAPHVQHLQRRTAPGGFVEGEVDGGRGVVAAVPADVHTYDEEGLPTDEPVIAHDHHRTVRVREDW